MSLGEQFQRFGDWFEQRAEYRKQALQNLRRREGLPTSEHLRGAFYQRADGFYREPPGKEVFLDTTMYPNGDGGFSQWAVGSQKQLSDTYISGDSNGATAIRHVPTAEVSAGWGRPSQFEILEVAEDGRSLQDELRDLDRDSKGMEIAERVSHGAEGEQAPGFELNGTSDEEVDAKLQEYLKRGSNG